MQISPGYEQKAVLTKAHAAAAAAVTTATNGALTDGGGVAAADAHYAVGDLVQICADMERINVYGISLPSLRICKFVDVS